MRVKFQSECTLETRVADSQDARGHVCTFFVAMPCSCCQVPIDGDLLADGDGLSAAEQVCLFVSPHRFLLLFYGIATGASAALWRGGLWAAGWRRLNDRARVCCSKL